MSRLRQLTSARQRTVTVLELRGVVDAECAARLDAELATVDGDVHLECFDLAFLDSAGLAVVLRAHDNCRVRGCKLVIHGLRPSIRRPLELVGLHRKLNLAS
jgi:anti-anti-sigma factor